LRYFGCYAPLPVLQRPSSPNDAHLQPRPDRCRCRNRDSDARASTTTTATTTKGLGIAAARNSDPAPGETRATCRVRAATVFLVHRKGSCPSRVEQYEAFALRPILPQDLSRGQTRCRLDATGWRRPRSSARRAPAGSRPSQRPRLLRRRPSIAAPFVTALARIARVVVQSIGMLLVCTMNRFRINHCRESAPEQIRLKRTWKEWASRLASLPGLGSAHPLAGSAGRRH
jgi:hypothetical protein